VPDILTLDVGTSSVRALLFDGRACEIDGVGAQLPYQVTTTHDGGVEVDAEHLAGLAFAALDEACRQSRSAGRRPAAVAICTFWHNVLGVEGEGKPATPVLHLFDTRAAAAARALAARIDARAQHARTGCVLHPSYLPAKLLWLAECRPEAFRAGRQWMSLGEYLSLRLFGKAAASVSMVSGSGLWNQNANDYDPEILSLLPIGSDQLSPRGEMDRPLAGLLPEFRRRWPELAEIPWFPAWGDGACNNVGSGCITPGRFSLMVGTSGAMRAVFEREHIEIPDGLWCYRVDRRRFVLGGALSNGGNVYAWMRRTLALPGDPEVERVLAGMAPGSHALTVVPLFAGERSTGWRPEARAAIAGMSIDTTPLEILRAALEAVALRFRNIYELMAERLGAPEQIVASGGALLSSRAWTQMMADALGRPVVACLEREASSRGAALLALERIGAIAHIRDLPARMGEAFEPVREHSGIYQEMLEKQRRLYRKLFEESW